MTVQPIPDPDETSPPSAPIKPTSRRPNLPPGQHENDTQRAAAGRDQDTDEAITVSVSNDGASRRPNLPPGHLLTDTHAWVAGRDQDDQQPAQHDRDAQPAGGGLLVDPTLYTLAAGLDDIEAVRKAQANRLGALTRTTPDKDGEVRGFGLTDGHPAVAVLQAQRDGLKALEDQMVLALKRQLRAHPLHPWIKAQNGLGEKTVARLLAAIGDPYWNGLHGRPRTVGELFAFCGVAGPGLRRRKLTKEQKAAGERAVTWSPDARVRLFNIFEPILKNRRSPYRAVYDAGRERYAEAVHTEQCAQCGTKGKPAEVGTPWRDGHKHAGARRLVMREILRDLWTEAKRIHERAE